MAIYPNLPAGTKLTAADLAALQPVIIYKTASTDRTSTTTLTIDPELQFSLAAGAVYVIEFFLFYGGNTGLIKTQWSVPSGASGNRSAMGPGSTSTGGTGSNADNISMRSGVHGYGTSVIYGNRGTGSLNLAIAVETSLITTSSAGTCGILWAQSTSSTDATRMGVGSWARATRIS